MVLKLGMDHRGLNFCRVSINDGPGMALTYLTARSNFVEIAYFAQMSGERLQDHWSSGLFLYI